MHIKIKKGLNIPIEGAPEGSLQPFKPSGQSSEGSTLKKFALDLTAFEHVSFKLLKKVGDTVQIGEAVAEDKKCPGRAFVAPAAGTIVAIKRGLRRRILDIVIEAAADETEVTHKPLDPAKESKETLIKRLMEGGLFNRFIQRPFLLLANPKQTPRSIFVKAIESAPFTPPAEMQVAGHEEAFQKGLDTLAALSPKVHLVYSKETSCSAFTKAHGVTHHTAEGPHPVANASLHIEMIDPIKGAEDVVWTISAKDVVAIGYLIGKGRYHNKKVVAIAGNGLNDPRQSGFFTVREGIAISELAAGRLPKKPLRLISGDPLMGREVAIDDFLGLNDTVFSVIPECTKRELLHFFRLGVSKYSFSRAYLSGHLKGRLYPFTTSQHGEHRPFIDNSLYDRVMPLHVPTMQLVKAVMAEDFDLAEQLGLLEVAPEDFALPTFVCPSKMEMVEIIKKGIYAHALEMIE